MQEILSLLPQKRELMKNTDIWNTICHIYPCNFSPFFLGYLLAPKWSPPPGIHTCMILLPLDYGCNLDWLLTSKIWDVTLWLQLIRLPRTMWAWKGILPQLNLEKKPQPWPTLRSLRNLKQRTHMRHAWTTNPQELWDRKGVLLLVYVCVHLLFRNRWLVHLFVQWFTQSESENICEIKWSPDLLIPAFPMCENVTLRNRKKMTRGIVVPSSTSVAFDLNQQKTWLTVSHRDRCLLVSLSQHSKDRQLGILRWLGGYR